jgi:hypothetical protein
LNRLCESSVLNYYYTEMSTLHKDIFVGGKLHLPRRNTLVEDCFVALRSYSPQSKASGVLKLGGDKSFLIAKNITQDHYIWIYKNQHDALTKS